MKKTVSGKYCSNPAYLFVLLFAAVTACTAPTEPTGPPASPAIIAGATVPSFSRAITISYSQVPGTDQRNFPVLVSGTYNGLDGSPDLRWSGYGAEAGGKVANASGYDVGFYTNSNCSSGKMKWETEQYNGQTGDVAYWVLVPTVSHTKNTVFYLCYGNAAITSNQAQPSAVWDNNFLTVWHLADKGGLDLSNSADTKYALTNGGPVASAPGKIGGGTNKFFPDHAAGDSLVWYLDNRQVTIARNGAVTISLWKKILSQDVCGLVCDTPYDGNHITFNFGVDHNAINSMTLHAPYFCRLDWTYAKEGPRIDPIWCSPSSYSDRWVYITCVFNPSASQLKVVYLDGNEVGRTNNGGTTTANVAGFHLGQDVGGHAPDPSQFDEVRISKSVRSPDWIKTEFNNQNNPGSFYTLGSEVIH